LYHDCLSPDNFEDKKDVRKRAIRFINHYLFLVGLIENFQFLGVKTIALVIVQIMVALFGEQLVVNKMANEHILDLIESVENLAM